MKILRDIILSIIMIPFLLGFAILFTMGVIAHFPYWHYKRVLERKWKRFTINRDIKNFFKND